MKQFLIVVALAAVTVPVSAQWLNYPTPGIPRTADGRPNLTAPTPRTTDGKPDLTGLWRGPTFVATTFRPDPRDVLPWASDLAGKRAEEFFKTRPSYQCLPSGPEGFRGMKRILHTAGVIAILNEDLTYRQIFMDGRALESAPYPTWMGYSVARWEGDTLVVDSVGFNDRTWLNNVGLPHTEALRMTERYQRTDIGHLRINVTFTDPAAYTKPQTFTVNMELAVDTEMLETVCEVGSDRWVGSVAELRRTAITVAPDVLALYVGRYSGQYGGSTRTVDVRLSDGELSITGLLSPDPAALIAASDSLFTSGEGLSYQFVRDSTGTVTQVVEIHASGNYPFRRQR